MDLHAVTDERNIDCSESPLYSAVKNGNVETVELLLKNEDSFNNIDLNAMLNLVVATGQNEIIELLLKNHVDIDAKTNRGETALHLAVRKERETGIKLLLARNANVNVSNSCGNTPLDGAVENGNVDIVKLLITHGVAVNSTTIDRALHGAVLARNTDIIQFLLLSGADVDAKNEKDETPLYVAVERMSLDVVEYLLSFKPSLSNIYNRFSLLVAVLKYHIEIVEALINYGFAANSEDLKDFDSKYINCNTRRSVYRSKSTNSEIVNELCVRLAGAVRYKVSIIIKLLLNYGIGVNNELRPRIYFNLNLFNTPLHVAVENRDADIVKLLLNNGVRINSLNTQGETPLYVAIKNGFKDIAELLLESNADVNHKRKDGGTPLHAALKSNHKDIVKLLLENGAEINSMDKQGETPLYMAIRNFFIDIAELLLEFNADVNHKLRDGGTLLHAALKSNHENNEKFLLESGAEINSMYEQDDIPFHIAQLTGCAMLSESNADVNHRQRDGGTLHLASESKHVNIVKLLLENGAEVNLSDERGETCLFLAIRNGFKDIAELLLESNADVNHRRRDGGTPLQEAFESEHADIEKLLLENGAEVNFINKNGRTPLLDAIKSCNVNTVKILLEHGADPNAKCSEGMNSLHYAVTIHHHILLKLILEANVDIDSLCNKGESPLFTAFRHKFYDTVDILLDYNADMNIVNKAGNAAFGFPLNCDFDHDELFEISHYLSLPQSFLDKLLKHYIKRCKADLYVHSTIVEFYSQFSCDDPSYEIFDFEGNCNEEIYRMKRRVLLKGTASLHDILTNNLNQLARYVCNEDVDIIMKNIDFEQEFPIYSKMLCIQYKKGKARKVLLEQFDFCKSNFPIWHPDCIDKITSYISNYDLKNLVKACQVTNENHV